MIENNSNKSFEFYSETFRKISNNTSNTIISGKVTSEVDAENIAIEHLSNEFNSYSTFYNNVRAIQQQKSSNDFNLEDTGLSEKTLNYFNKLEELNEASNFSGMVTLMEKYKLEYDSDLVALAGVFSVIEYYKNDLLNNSVAQRGCEGDGRALAGAVVGGALMGARVGWIFGSFLGPAGTAAGAAGGAIIGAIGGAIINIAWQMSGSDCVN